SDGVVATDDTGFIRFLSPVAEKLTGWSSREAFGRPVEQVYRLSDIDGHPIGDCQLRKVIRSGLPAMRATFLLHAKAGERAHIEDAAAPITNADGMLIGAVSIFTDISARREIERERLRFKQELERSNEELSSLSHTLAHDLAAPARTMSTLSRLLEERAQGQLD